MNMQYEQSRQNLKVGTLPATIQQVRELAAIQLQITVGDHREDKHLPGTIE